MSNKLGYPVRMYIKGFHGELYQLMEYKDIREANLPDSLFQVPKDYKKSNYIVFKGKNSHH